MGQTPLLILTTSGTQDDARTITWFTGYNSIMFTHGLLADDPPAYIPSMWVHIIVIIIAPVLMWDKLCIQGQNGQWRGRMGILSAFQEDCSGLDTMQILRLKRRVGTRGQPKYTPWTLLIRYAALLKGWRNAGRTEPGLNW